MAHIADGVLVRLDKLSDHRHTVPVGEGQDHRAPVPHRASTAPTHDLLQPLPLLVGLRTRTGSATAPPAVGSDVTPHPTVTTTNPANLCGQNTSLVYRVERCHQPDRHEALKGLRATWRPFKGGGGQTRFSVGHSWTHRAPEAVCEPLSCTLSIEPNALRIHLRVAQGH